MLPGPLVIVSNPMSDPTKDDVFRQKTPLRSVCYCFLNTLLIVFSIILIFWSLWLGRVFVKFDHDYDEPTKAPDYILPTKASV